MAVVELRQLEDGQPHRNPCVAYHDELLPGDPIIPALGPSTQR
ncbi:hypothetical protein [Tessaracoccus coleopterorum]|nr:hypothetical protein [Tessaracoccus coleopterorum]